MATVQLKKYDISKGMAKSLSPLLLGTTIEGVWHTAILVFEQEIFYGGGIQVLPPSTVERTYDMRPHSVLNLGTTSKTQVELQKFLKDNFDRFTEKNYDLLHWNCNHFTNEVSQFLCGSPIPREIVCQHESIAATPLGGMIMNSLQGLQRNMQAQAQATGQRTLWTAGGGAPSSSSSSFSGLSTTTSSTTTAGPTDFGKVLRESLMITTTSRDSSQDVMTFLQTLARLAGNLIANATDEKYRRVDANNALIKERILSFPKGAECLAALGFEPVVDGSNNISHFQFSGPVSMEKLQLLKTNQKILAIQMESPTRGVLDSPLYVESHHHQSAAARSTLITPEPNLKGQLKQLAEMGFTDENQNKRVLKETNGNINQAIDRLALLQ